MAEQVGPDGDEGGAVWENFTGEGLHTCTLSNIVIHFLAPSMSLSVLSLALTKEPHPSVDEAFTLVAEVDGVRIISNTACEFLRRCVDKEFVPGSFLPCICPL